MFLNSFIKSHFRLSSISKHSFSTLKNLSLKNLPKETLFILDGTNILFRSYFIHSKSLSKVDQEHLTSSTTFSEECSQFLASEFPTIFPNDLKQPRFSCGTLKTFALMITNFIRDVKPKYLAVAFDYNSNTFRHQIYPQYKQGRNQTPIEVKQAAILSPLLAHSLGCHCFMMEGYEADDIMATLSKFFLHPNNKDTKKENEVDEERCTVLVSPDKDMLQLVREGSVYSMDITTKRLLGAKEVQEKYSPLSCPSQLPAYFSLVGDRVDNIPGVKGIGPKVGGALVKYFDTLPRINSSSPLPFSTPSSISSMTHQECGLYRMYKHLDLIPSPIEGSVGMSQDEISSTSILATSLKPLDHLSLALQQVRATPKVVLSKLKTCPWEDLQKYKKLVTLIDEVPICGLKEGSLETCFGKEFSLIDQSNSNVDWKKLIKNRHEFVNQRPQEIQSLRFIGKQFFVEQLLESMSAEVFGPVLQKINKVE